MAKITARGDREVARWTGPDGRCLVLTAKGRLLSKLSRTSNYHAYGRTGDVWTRERAAKLAKSLDLTATRVRA